MILKDYIVKIDNKNFLNSVSQILPVFGHAFLEKISKLFDIFPGILIY
jgi:hypothetical protein